MKPFRYDRDRYGGGILVYVRERTPIKELRSYKPPNDIECGLFEFTIKKSKMDFDLHLLFHRLNLSNISFVRLVKHLTIFVQNMKTSVLSETSICGK